MISYIDNVKNVVTEVPITIAASSWSSSAPYTYTWTDSRVLAGSSVDVDILATTVDTSVISLDYEKAVGSVTFTANVKPTANIAVTIRIINARADLGTSISADTVATNAISGASNVDQALSVISSDNIITHVSSNDAFSSLSALKTGLQAVLNQHLRSDSASMVFPISFKCTADPFTGQWTTGIMFLGNNANYCSGIFGEANGQMFSVSIWNNNLYANKVALRYPIRNVPTTVSIGSIAAGSGASGNADVQIPSGYSFMSIIPRYTKSGLCIASAYPVSGAASGYQRITVYVRNITTAAVSGETANVDVIFSMD